jgi:hypothetical protein
MPVFRKGIKKVKQDLIVLSYLYHSLQVDNKGMAVKAHTLNVKNNGVEIDENYR